MPSPAPPERNPAGGFDSSETSVRVVLLESCNSVSLVRLTCVFLEGCVMSPLDVAGLGKGETVELLGDIGADETDGESSQHLEVGEKIGVFDLESDELLRDACFNNFFFFCLYIFER